MTAPSTRTHHLTTTTVSSTQTCPRTKTRPVQTPSSQVALHVIPKTQTQPTQVARVLPGSRGTVFISNK